MRKTRTEILMELRCQLGPGEQTEHLIDWILDAWQTTDFLIRRFGRASTLTIIEAVESSSLDFRLDDFVVWEPTHEALQCSLLN